MYLEPWVSQGVKERTVARRTGTEATRGGEMETKERPSNPESGLPHLLWDGVLSIPHKYSQNL